jgi:hypothetical protein
MLTYVIYGHTDYLDVLKIQTEYNKDIKNKVLLINQNNTELEIYSVYDKIIFYDDTLPYASRLLALKELGVDYILMTQDTDLIIEKNSETLERIVSKMKEKGLDRVDLQYREFTSDGIQLNPNTNRIDMGDFRLTKQEDIPHLIFNLNPSIWKLSTLMDVMTKFKNESYRTIEKKNTVGIYEIQKYCLQLEIYKVANDNPINCGYYQCLEFYQYFHITKRGQWFPFNGGARRLDRNDKFISEWDKIINKFQLRKSSRAARVGSVGTPFYKQ